MHYRRWRIHGTVSDSVGRPRTNKERFERIGWNENDSGCFIWSGYKNSEGYGSFRFEGAMVHAHRVSYLLYKGEFDRKLVIRHTCDTPSCVNPGHLIPGTPLDNVSDCVERDRRSSQSAENNHNAKLNWKTVREIRSRYLKGTISQDKLAYEYSVTQVLISKIVRNTIWIEEVTQ